MTVAVDLFAWLPPHLIDIGRRWGFGVRAVRWSEPHAGGTVWLCDGGCALDSGLPAKGRAPAGSEELEALIARPRGRACEPSLEYRGGARLVHDRFVDPGYVEIIEGLWPGATWEVVEPCEMDAELLRRVPGAAHVLVVWHGGRPRAVVMPVRLRDASDAERTVQHG